jgi:hypothetical protein
MDLEKDQVSLDLGNVKSFGFQLLHLREKGPSILMQLTKQEGAYWCSSIHSPSQVLDTHAERVVPSVQKHLTRFRVY